MRKGPIIRLQASHMKQTGTAFQVRAHLIIETSSDVENRHYRTTRNGTAAIPPLDTRRHE